MNRVKINRQSELSKRPAKLFSILSGKGGVGKSVVAYNMAERAASLGLSTLLVDVDVTCGNLHILANIESGGGLQDFLESKRTLNDAVTVISKQLSLLPSRGDTLDLNTTLSAKLITKLRKEATGYDLVILDHPSGRNEATPVLAYGSDVNLLLVIPELTSISDAYGLFRHLISEKASLDCRLLVNRAEDADEADFLQKRFIAMCEQFAGRTIEPAGTLLEDKAIRASVAAQRPASLINNQSVVVQALTRIVRRLMLLQGEPKIKLATFPKQRINETAATADIRE